MRNSRAFLAAAMLALAACSENGDSMAYEAADAAASPENQFALFAAEEAAPVVERVTTVDIEEPEVAPEVASPVEPDGAVAAPQIAYRYELGFRVPATSIKPLQDRHADMCEARGPNVCRIISMRQSDSDGDYAYGSLQIAVASSEARAFSRELETASGNADGELISSSITGEDLSKQIVDTEARLRARTLLRDRLMDILRTRSGTVAELVEAERGVAQVNQEIDQARSWLNEMRGRVAFSNMTISYESGSRQSGGFSEPIAKAWNSLGTILGTIIAFLMMAATVLIPIGLVIYVALRIWRWVRARNPAAKPEGGEADGTAQEESPTG